MRHHTDWTPDIVERLIALAATERFSAVEIAERLGREFKIAVGKSSVLGKLFRLGVRLPIRRKARDAAGGSSFTVLVDNTRVTISLERIDAGKPAGTFL